VPACHHNNSLHRASTRRLPRLRLPRAAQRHCNVAITCSPPRAYRHLVYAVAHGFSVELAARYTKQIVGWTYLAPRDYYNTAWHSRALYRDRGHDIVHPRCVTLAT